MQRYAGQKRRNTGYLQPVMNVFMLMYMPAAQYRQRLDECMQRQAYEHGNRERHIAVVVMPAAVCTGWGMGMSMVYPFGKKIQHGLYQQSGHNTQPYRMRRQFGIYLRQHVEHYYAYHESTGKTGYEIYRAFSYPFTEKTYGKHCQHGCSEKYYIIRHKGIYFSVGRKFTSKITFPAIRMTVKKRTATKSIHVKHTMKMPEHNGRNIYHVT